MPQHTATAERWAASLDEELGFWWRWLRNKGDTWPEDYKRRIDPRSALQPELHRHISARVGARVRILDVGSGPLTAIGKRWRWRRVSITAVDPLADRYAALFARLGLNPPVRPIQGEAERVAELLPHGSFDLAFAANSLDHGYDPLRSIRQMLQLVKPGSKVVLDHMVNEGERMRYANLHQWNFRADDGRLVIWRPGLELDAHACLLPYAEIEIEPLDDPRWLRVVLRRR